MEGVLRAPGALRAGCVLRVLARYSVPAAEAAENFREADGEDGATDDEAARAEGARGGPCLAGAVEIPRQEEAGAHAQPEPVIADDEQAKADDGQQEDRRPEKHAVMRLEEDAKRIRRIPMEFVRDLAGGAIVAVQRLID